MGNEVGQGLQGGAQSVQAALQGGQACLQLLLLGLKLRHHLIRDALCLQRWRETEWQREGPGTGRGQRAKGSRASIQFKEQLGG